MGLYNQKDGVVFPFLEVLEAQLSLLEPFAKDSSRDTTI